MSVLMDWCTAILGPCKVLSGARRPDARSGTSRLRARGGHCFLKVHQDPGSTAPYPYRGRAGPQEKDRPFQVEGVG